MGAPVILVALASFAMLLPGAASAAPGAGQTKWLCKPGQAANPCASPLATTERGPDGKDKILKAKPAKKPEVDCFYVYPTVSGQSTLNATLAVDPEIAAIAQQQASRFSQACRVYAPVYREVTIAGITSTDSGKGFAIAYGDVRTAWRNYMKKYNHGRGVILIGHSQGAGHLSQLLAEEIDPRPKLRSRLVAAYLLGGNVTVPIGKTVGGSFKHTPACTTKLQISCVVAWSMFDATPPDDALFGRIGGAFTSGNPKKFEVLCTDPNKLLGRKSSWLEPFIRTEAFPGPLGAVTPPAPEATTPWVSFPKLYSAHCAHGNGADWLQVDYKAKAGDDRPRFNPTLGPTWGLHLGDVNLALGNLVALAKIQAKEYLFESVSE